MSAEGERGRLRDLCGEFYVIFGHLDAPAQVLDQALAAASGWDLPHGTLLPYPAQALSYTPVPSDPECLHVLEEPQQLRLPFEE